MTRVLVLCGHGDQLRWVDYGAPFSDDSSPSVSEAFPFEL